MSPRQVPKLDSGIALVHTPDRATPAAHRFATELFEHGSPGYWIGSGDLASTYTLFELGESARSLRNLRIGRAFTPFQHHSLIRQVVREASPRIEGIVAPEFPRLYFGGDLPGDRGEKLFRSSVEMLSQVGDALDIPVVVTASGAQDILSLETAATTHIVCERTDFGLRFTSESFTSHMYWDKGMWQTTIPYWVALYGAVSDADRPVELSPSPDPKEMTV